MSTLSLTNKVVELEGPAKRLALRSEAEDESSPPRIILQVDRVGGRRRPIPSSRSRHVNLQHHPLAHHGPSPGSSVDRRNARERRRVRLVNLGFTALRQHVPPRGASKNKKMSKVETLRAAIEYIKQLQEAVSDSQEEIETHPDDDAQSAGMCTSPSTTEALSPAAGSSSPSSSSFCSSLPSFLDNDSYSSASPMFLDDEDEDFLELVDLVL